MDIKAIDKAEARITFMLSAYLDGCEEFEAVTDLLADIRHYCDRRGLSFSECDKQAHQHYLAEVFGDD